MKLMNTPMAGCILRNYNVKRYVTCTFHANNWKQRSIISTIPSKYHLNHLNNVAIRHKSDNNSSRSPLSEVIVPVTVKVNCNPDDINIGEELSGSKLKSEDINQVLMQFYRRPPIKTLSSDQGMDPTLYQKAFASFKSHCVDTPVVEPELHIILDEIIRGFRHVDDLFPLFLKHARMVYPHLECLDELKKISDLRLPHSWYPEARSMKRKVIFHCGPTNSGKTYNALKAFMSSESGVYCGPLKLLAVEVNNKCNDSGTKCDLVTGEERKYAMSEEEPSSHVSCTVEMVDVANTVDVAIIDEIQMVRDMQRGWAWTRALLGIPCKELHLCGESAAIDLVRQILSNCDEVVEVRNYSRLTPLAVQEEPLLTLTSVQPGDCIVCFNKADIFNVSLQLEKLGKSVAVIYGSLPPSTKLNQARRFNDPNDECKILIATDAIGMGLNLSIKRIIFYSITKPTNNEKGEKKMELISTSSALQIAGRAGRFNTNYNVNSGNGGNHVNHNLNYSQVNKEESGGLVTTMFESDLQQLKRIMSQSIEPINFAGIHPTADQIEMFAYYLPEASLSNLIDVFTSLCQINSSHYFMCNVEDFKFLADMIQHVPLPLRSRYVFCCAPINRKSAYVCTMFLKYARLYSSNEPVSAEWLRRNILWPFDVPNKIQQLFHMEQVFDCLDLYLWLSYRFPDLFHDQDSVRSMQQELDQLIHIGVANITKLLKTASNDSAVPSKVKRETKSSSSSSNDSTNDDELSLTQELIKSGIISKRLMDKLQNEWGKKLINIDKKSEDNNEDVPKKFNQDDDKKGSKKGIDYKSIYESAKKRW